MFLSCKTLPSTAVDARRKPTTECNLRNRTYLKIKQRTSKQPMGQGRNHKTLNNCKKSEI